MHSHCPLPAMEQQVALSPPVQPVKGVTRNRKKVQPHPIYGLTKKTLDDYMTTPEELEAKKAARAAARAVLDSLLNSSEVPGPDKHHAKCEYILRWGRCLYQCPQCWMLPANCVCSQMQQCEPATKVVLLLHSEEYAKGSNTGCITHKSLVGSELLVRGHKQHDARLQQLLDDPSITTAVLWPGPTALDPQQLQQLAQERSQGRIGLIALDATWENARRMRGRLPDELPQLQLPPDLALSHGGSTSLFAPLRKMGKEKYAEGRVCTLEAVAGALLALEAKEAGAALYEGLLGNLKVKVDAMRRQKHMETVYDT